MYPSFPGIRNTGLWDKRQLPKKGLAKISDLATHAQDSEHATSFYSQSQEPNEVSVTDMIELEEELSSALMHTRSRKTQMMMDRISTFHENEKKLTQQNLQLKQNQQVAESEQKDDVEIDVNDGDGGGDVVELAKDDNYQTNTSSLFTLPLFKE
ncbi:hypothetical protein LXL04_004870 [Taraxacum kok-saghyz]